MMTEQAANEGMSVQQYERRIRELESELAETRAALQARIDSELAGAGFINADAAPRSAPLSLAAELERARMAFEQQARELEAVFNAQADAVMVYSPDGVARQVNPAAKEAFGFDPTGMEEARILEILKPTGGLDSSIALAALRGETVIGAERDGPRGFAQVSGAPIRDNQGRITGAVTVAHDITRIKQAQAELRDRSERLALLYYAAAELLSSADPLALLDRIYERLATLLGLEIYLQYNLAKDGSALELCASAGFSEDTTKLLDRLELGEGVCGLVAQTLHIAVLDDVQQDSDPRSATIRSMGLTAYACLPMIVHGRLVGTLAFGTRRQAHFDPEAILLLRAVCDLVAAAIDRKQASLDLQAYADQLERSNRDLQEFAFVASHDMQEPLRKVEMFGEMLMQSTENMTERQRDYVNRMSRSAERMHKMIDGLLQLSRVTTHAHPFEPVDIGEMVTEVLSDLEMQIARTGATVAVGSLPVMEGDPLQLRQLFQNLIGNALKFQPQGQPPKVTISAQTEGPGTVRFLVSDNGIGFDEKNAERMFEPFQRLVGRSEYEGSGMGLAICRKIVERHGGKISAHSQPGQGTTINILLPLRHNKGK